MNGEIIYLLNDSERLILLIEGNNNADRKETLSKNIEEIRRILSEAEVDNQNEI